MSLDFDNKTTYGDDDKCIKTYEDSITANFYNKKGSKKIPHKCLDSVVYVYEKYHPQIFLEECKYVKENIKTKNYINEQLKSEFDTDTDNEE